MDAWKKLGQRNSTSGRGSASHESHLRAALPRGTQRGRDGPAGGRRSRWPSPPAAARVPACPRFAPVPFGSAGSRRRPACLRAGRSPLPLAPCLCRHPQPAIVLQKRTACHNSLLNAKLPIINKHGPNNSSPDLTHCGKQPQK